jgi:hypothetical protein
MFEESGTNSLSMLDFSPFGEFDGRILSPPSKVNKRHPQVSPFNIQGEFHHESSSSSKGD